MVSKFEKKKIVEVVQKLCQELYVQQLFLIVK
jgi:hypothetical protein